MLEDTKPTLRKEKYIVIPAPFMPITLPWNGWVCKSRFGYGEAITPKEAYAAWDKNRTKSFIGRAVDAFIDRFGFGLFVFFGFVPAMLVAIYLYFA
jgi:hypothetical protein